MRVPTRKSEQKAPRRESDYFITPEKYAEIEKSLKHLKEVKRPRESAEVKRLAAMGDFSENAGYQLAKSRLRGINRRIDEAEDLLKKAEIIKADGSSDKIEVGHLVSLEIKGKKKEYRILGSNETDPDQNIISYTSPLGSALLGKKVGDMAEISTGRGISRYKILGIRI